MNHMQVCAERKTIPSDACLQCLQDHFIIIQMLNSLVDIGIKFLFSKSLRALVSVIYSNYCLDKMMPSFLHELFREEVSKTSIIF